MTKEEARETLISILRDVNSDEQDMSVSPEDFTNAMLIAIDVLQEPSVTSDIDVAELEYINSTEYSPATQEDELMIYNAFKAGFIKGREAELSWTSVKDRLPEVGDIVLVHDKICCTMRLAQLCKSGNWIYRRETEYDYKVATVDYWMSIPKLPKEEKK